MTDHDDLAPDLYALPDLEDEAYWERHHAAGLHQPEPPAPPPGDGYQWVDLTRPEDRKSVV